MFPYIVSPLGERRGVGGIFFDDVDEPSADKCFDFLTVSLTEMFDIVNCFVNIK